MFFLPGFHSHCFSNVCFITTASSVVYFTKLLHSCDVNYCNVIYLNRFSLLMKTFVNHVTKFEFYLIINNLNNSIVPVPSRWVCYSWCPDNCPRKKSPQPYNCSLDDCPRRKIAPRTIAPKIIDPRQFPQFYKYSETKIAQEHIEHGIMKQICLCFRNR